jgi:hypothetical protein
MEGEGHHVLTDDDVQALDRHAREVGGVIGWDLQRRNTGISEQRHR